VKNTQMAKRFNSQLFVSSTLSLSLSLTRVNGFLFRAVVFYSCFSAQEYHFTPQMNN